MRPQRLLTMLFAIVTLHVLAWALAPGRLWGLSHLAAWPAAWAWGATAVVLLLLFVATRRPLDAPPFPGWRGAVVAALVAGMLFWLLRERTHFFGDGYLLIRDRGMSESVTRAPLLVASATRAVRLADSHLGFAAETTLALLAVVAGVVGIFLLLRLAASIGSDRTERWTLAILLASAGSVQLFFGHVEYYAALAAGVLLYLALATRALARERWTAIGLWSYGALLPLHLSTLGLAPAHAYLFARAWRAGRRRQVLLALPGCLLLAWGLTRIAGGGASELASTSFAGWSRYTDPFFDASTARHAFGFLSPSHLLAVANDLLLAAPLLLVVLPTWWAARRNAARQSSSMATALGRFLALAALGCVGVNLLFARELGPYRDWDILAAYGFVGLTFTGVVLLRAGAGRYWLPYLLCALYHTLPWVVMNASDRAVMTHLRLVLAEESQWSPHAHAYMHESLAIYYRERGDEVASLREYEAAVQANPADSRYRVGLGNRYVQRGDMRAAAREYQQAVEQRPGYAPGHNNLAFVLAALGEELERARHHAQEALRLDPSNADYWLTLARVEVADGRRLQAGEAARRALTLRRSFPAAEELLRGLEE